MMKIKGMSQKQKEVLELLIDGNSQNEAAKLLGISRRAVVSRLQNFRRNSPDLAENFDSALLSQKQSRVKLAKPVSYQSYMDNKVERKW